MKILRNNQGFTIMEIMIVIIIIAVAISLSLYSINIVFSSNAESFADQYKADLRLIRDQNMSTTGSTFSITWKDDGSGNVSYEIYESGVLLPIRTETIHRAVQVTYSKGPIDGVTILFDASDGTVIDDPLGNNGAGTYQFANNASGTSYTVTLTEATGRIE